MIQTAKAYAAQPDVAKKLKEFKVVSTGEEALGRLEDFNGVEPLLKEIHRLENEGDRITREALKELFNDHLAPADLIKWKDVYALLEETMDECEHCAEVIETLSIKNA